MAGDGDVKVKSTKALTESQAMKLCANPKFLPSVTINHIGKLLKT